MADKSLSAEQMRAYWDRTSKLMYGILFIWFIFSFVVHIFAAPLNNIRIFGFPLGFYMAAQGSLIVFVFLCWWNARAQNKIDEEFGVSDE